MPLDDLRKKIDAIDQELVALLSRRGETALEIGREKTRLNRIVQDAMREDEVFNHVAKLNKGPFSDADLRRFFETLVAACSGLQEEQSDGSADT